MFSFSQQRRKVVDKGESRAGRYRLRAPEREGVSAQSSSAAVRCAVRRIQQDENEQ